MGRSRGGPLGETFARWGDRANGDMVPVQAAERAIAGPLQTPRNRAGPPRSTPGPGARAHRGSAAARSGQTMVSSAGTSSATGGYLGFRPAIVSARIVATARLRNHLRSAGMTYHGATSVEVFDRASSKAAW